MPIPVFRVDATLDRDGQGKRQVWRERVGSGHAWLQEESGARACTKGHTAEFEVLVHWIRTRPVGAHICPSCDATLSGTHGASAAAAVVDVSTASTAAPATPWDFFQPTLTLWDTVVATPMLSSLRTALGTSGLAADLGGTGSFTLFAPNDAAFASLSTTPSGADLVKILKHHVVDGTHPVDAIPLGGSTTLTTLAGTTLVVSRNLVGMLYVDGVQVVMPDIWATNGVMHITTAVLIPSDMKTKIGMRPQVDTTNALALAAAALFHNEDIGPVAVRNQWNVTVTEAVAATPRLSALANAFRATNLRTALNASGPFTLFAPLNSAFALLRGSPSQDELKKILLHHVIPTELMDFDMPEGSASYPTLAGDTLTIERIAGGKIVIDGVASITRANFVATNGVVHIIDRVLQPRPTSGSVATQTTRTASGSSVSAATAAGAVTMATEMGAGSSGALPGTLFAAFNIAPAPFTTHRSEGATPPVDLLTFEVRMPWSAKRSGYVLPFERQSAAYGVPIDTLISEARWTNEVEIAYTVMMPKNWDQAAPGANDDKTVILMLHGVPTSRKWKYHMMEIMARRGAIVVAPDLLGMGDSTQPMNFGHSGPEDADGTDNPDNDAWDWKNDVGWLHALIKYEILRMARLGFKTKRDVVVAADDWGAGPAEWLLAMKPKDVGHLVLINPIHLDGYFVVEIGTIGRADEVRCMGGNAKFQEAAFSLTQTLFGIEKYMVQDRKRLNRYTESSFLSTYQDTRYQSGATAADMRPHYWNLAVLAARASRLAPRQLQPYDADENPSGLHVERIPSDKPVDIIWGIEDQMMPPVQVFRSVYLFPGRVQGHFIADANHFSEVDQPYRVADAMTMAILRENKLALPIFLGDSPEFVYKGDEAEMRLQLAALFPKAPTTSIAQAPASEPAPEAEPAPEPAAEPAPPPAVFPKKVMSVAPPESATFMTLITLTGSYNQEIKLYYGTRTNIAAIKTYVRTVTQRPNAVVELRLGYVVDDDRRLADIVRTGVRLVLYVDLDAHPPVGAAHSAASHLAVGATPGDKQLPRVAATPRLGAGAADVAQLVYPVTDTAAHRVLRLPSWAINFASPARTGGGGVFAMYNHDDMRKKIVASRAPGSAAMLERFDRSAVAAHDDARVALDAFVGAAAGTYAPADADEEVAMMWQFFENYKTGNFLAGVLLSAAVTAADSALLMAPTKELNAALLALQPTFEDDDDVDDAARSARNDRFVRVETRRMKLYADFIKTHVLPTPHLVRDMCPRLSAMYPHLFNLTEGGANRLSAYMVDAATWLAASARELGRFYELAAHDHAEGMVRVDAGTELYVGRPKLIKALADLQRRDDQPLFIAIDPGNALAYTKPYDKNNARTGAAWCQSAGSIATLSVVDDLILVDMSNPKTILRMHAQMLAGTTEDKRVAIALDRAYAVVATEGTGELVVKRNSISGEDDQVVKWLCEVGGYSGYIAPRFGDFPSEIVLCKFEGIVRLDAVHRVADLNPWICTRPEAGLWYEF